MRPALTPPALYLGSTHSPHSLSAARRMLPSGFFSDGYVVEKEHVALLSSCGRHRYRKSVVPMSCLKQPVISSLHSGSEIM